MCHCNTSSFVIDVLEIHERFLVFQRCKSRLSQRNNQGIFTSKVLHRTINIHPLKSHYCYTEHPVENALSYNPAFYFLHSVGSNVNGTS